MRIKCVAAVANSRSGTGDGERGAKLHQPPSFSTVPPSPAKRVCVCHSGGRESQPPAGPHLGNASEHGRLAWLSAVSQSHAPLGIVWERVQNAALPLIERRRLLSHTHTQGRTTQMHGYKHPQWPVTLWISDVCKAVTATPPTLWHGSSLWWFVYSCRKWINGVNVWKVQLCVCYFHCLMIDISIQLWKALCNFGHGLYTFHLKLLASKRSFRALC